MRVILRREVKGVGKAGDVKDVADGYALNFLLPRGLAVRASEGALREVERERESVQLRREREGAEMRELAKRIEQTALSFALRSGAQGRVFGSVTNRDVAASLAARGIAVERAQVQLAEPIRSFGTHSVEVRLPGDVRAQLTVTVESAP